jgi:anti-sigma regulatory factor (Ser/Thr protein kinase)
VGRFDAREAAAGLVTLRVAPDVSGTSEAAGEPRVSRSEHPAFVYRSPDAFAAAIAPFIIEGVDRGEPVFVVVAPDELDVLRDATGSPDGVRWADTHRWHPIPATRLRAFYGFITDRLREGSTKVRVVGEPAWPPGPPEMVREWARYESVLNAVLAPFPVTLVCTYDATRLDPAIVADASRTHPILGLAASAVPSPDFEDPAALLARWNPPLPPPPDSAVTMSEPVDPASGRAFVVEQAARAGSSRGRTVDLALATSEVLTNALVHGGGGVRLRTWVEAGWFLCQIEDTGPGLADALAGYRPPGTVQERGRGLWLARQVVDLLRIAPGSPGTVVRMHLRVERT